MTVGRRAATALVVATLAALSGGCAESRGFHFDVAADMRFYTPPEYAGSEFFAGACAAIRDVGAGAFMLIPGDLDPPDRVRATLDAELGADYVMYPVIGNHELDEPEYVAWVRAHNGRDGALPGLVRTGPPGAETTCYSFDHENAHFVIINQYYDGAKDDAADGDMHPTLYDWLAADLAETAKRFIFVAGHEPTVAVADIGNGRVRHRGDSLDQYEQSNHRFWMLLREHDVTAYFCGHTHNASVAKINGVWQIDVGHARGKGDAGTLSTFVKVYVGADGVRCAFYRSDGGEYEMTYEERLR